MTYTITIVIRWPVKHNSQCNSKMRSRSRSRSRLRSRSSNITLVPAFLLSCLIATELPSGVKSDHGNHGTLPPSRSMNNVLCSIPQYDSFNLTERTWFITLEKRDCLPLKALNFSQPPDKCTVLMAFCHKVDSPGPCRDSSVCLSSNQGNLSIGGYTKDPFISTDVPSDMGFQFVFPDGGEYTTSSETPCRLKTSIVFECNHTAQWLPQHFSPVVQKAPDYKSIFYDNDTCEMTITFEYSGACKMPSHSVESLSTGSLLLIIFSVGLILYFVFGSMINIARGRTGPEIIPNGKFWMMLPVYIVDGFQFALCCGKLPVTRVYEEI